jgi:hypothetical protein
MTTAPLWQRRDDVRWRISDEWHIAASVKLRVDCACLGGAGWAPITVFRAARSYLAGTAAALNT